MEEIVPVLLKLEVSHVAFQRIVQMVNGDLDLARFSYQFHPNPIVGKDMVILDEEDLYELYPHIPPLALISQVAQFAHRELGLWIVYGENAVNRIRMMKGWYMDPEKCDAHTWRYRIDKEGMLPIRKHLFLRDRSTGEVAESCDVHIHSPTHKELPAHLRVFREFLE